MKETRFPAKKLDRQERYLILEADSSYAKGIREFSSYDVYRYLLFPRRLNMLYRRWMSYLLTERIIVFPDLYLLSFCLYLLLNPPITSEDDGLIDFPGSVKGNIIFAVLLKGTSSLLYFYQMEEMLKIQGIKRLKRLFCVEMLEELDMTSNWVFFLTMITYFNILFDFYLLICLSPPSPSPQSTDNHSSRSDAPHGKRDPLPSDLFFFQSLIIVQVFLLMLFPVCFEAWCKGQAYIKNRWR